MFKKSLTKMMVCDMAGTVINEGGLVYKTLYETLKNNNIPVKKQKTTPTLD